MRINLLVVSVELHHLSNKEATYLTRTATPQVMLEKDTGRPRGFGFLTYSDRRGMDDAIRDMHGREFGNRVISVNRAQPKFGGEDPGHNYGSYPSGGRGGYGGERSAGQDECFRCGQPGHWARDCPSAGGGRGARPINPPHSRYGGASSHDDRHIDYRDKYIEDRGRYGDRDRYDNRDDRYGSRDRYVSDRYPPAGDRFPVDRYGISDHYPYKSGYGKDRAAYDRGGIPRVSDDRYGGALAPPVRYGGRNYRDRPGPYDRPRWGGH